MNIENELTKKVADILLKDLKENKNKEPDYQYLEHLINQKTDDNLTFKIVPDLEDKYTLNLTANITPEYLDEILNYNQELFRWLDNEELTYTKGYDYNGDILYIVICDNEKEHWKVKHYCEEHNLSYDENIITDCKKDYCGSEIIISFTNEVF